MDAVGQGAPHADDVSPELARAAIASVTVLGAFQASVAVRRALSDRIH